MKRTTTIIMLTALACCLMTGCKLKTYYQVYQLETETGELADKDINKVQYKVHENNECDVLYNFYEENGLGGFWFTNKTDSVIYINLNESFIIINGVANDYFKSRRWTNTNSRTIQSNTTAENVKSKKRKKRSTITSQGSSQTSTDALAYDEKSVVIVPPHSTKHIGFEYVINTEKFEFCKFDDTPKGKKPVSRNFSSADESPLTLGNYVTYTVGCKGMKRHVDDRFYVATVHNMSTKAMFETYRTKDICQKNDKKAKRMKYSNPDRFYIIYKK